MSQSATTQSNRAKAKGGAKDGSRRPRRQNIFRRIIHGNVLTSDFFKHNWLKVVVAVVLIMIYISTKYQCMTSMETIKKLENEVDVIKTESVRERSAYMSRIRESAISEFADSIRPGLRVAEQPPYVLNYSSSTK